MPHYLNFSQPASGANYIIQMQGIPNWLMRRVPKNKSFDINYTDGVWKLNGKVVTRFDKSQIAKAIETAKHQEGEK